MPINAIICENMAKLLQQRDFITRAKGKTPHERTHVYAADDNLCELFCHIDRNRTEFIRGRI